MPEYTLDQIDAEIARRSGGTNTYSMDDIDAEIARRAEPQTKAQAIYDQFGVLGSVPSAALSAFTGMGDLVDLLGTGVSKAARFMNPLAGAAIDATGLKAPSIGGALRSGADWVTGVPDSTKIGEGTLPYKITQYGVGGLLGPGAIPAKLATGAVSGAGAYVGNEIGGPVGEIIGATAAGITPGLLAKTLQGKLPAWASALDRRSIGARQSDYAKTANDLNMIEAADELPQSLTKVAINDLIDTGVIGKSREPAQMLKNLRGEESKLQTQIGSIIKGYEEAGGAPVKPMFANAMKMLEEGSIPGDKVDSFLERLGKIDSSIAANGNKLSYIQKQKIALGQLWDPADSTANAFNRALYKDLQTTIEGAVPEIGAVNKQLQKVKVVKPILQRGIAAEETATGMDKAIQAIKTTGGFGSAITAGGLAGGPLGALAGLGTAAAGRYLMGPSGQALRASAYKAAAPLAEKLAKTVIPTAIKSALVASNNIKSKDNRSIDRAMSEAEKKMDEKAKAEAPKLLAASRIPTKKIEQVAADFEPLVKAVIAQESGGNPNARSEVGAQGLMQLMPATGRELFKKAGLEGEYNPNDPEQNVMLGSMYLKQLLEQFDGDIELALTAYHSGPGRVRALLKRTGGNSFADIRDLLGPVGKKYAPSVISRMRKAKTIQI